MEHIWQACLNGVPGVPWKWLSRSQRGPSVCNLQHYLSSSQSVSYAQLSPLQLWHTMEYILALYPPHGPQFPWRKNLLYHTSHIGWQLSPSTICFLYTRWKDKGSEMQLFHGNCILCLFYCTMYYVMLTNVKVNKSCTNWLQSLLRQELMQATTKNHKLTLRRVVSSMELLALGAIYLQSSSVVKLSLIWTGLDCNTLSVWKKKKLLRPSLAGKPIVLGCWENGK